MTLRKYYLLSGEWYSQRISEDRRDYWLICASAHFGEGKAPEPGELFPLLADSGASSMGGELDDEASANLVMGTLAGASPQQAGPYLEKV